jgi:hypothetical protein
VIAKLVSQRAASGSSSTSSRSRSSIGTAKAGKARTSAGSAGGVVMSAKKRARQSEYVRRRSRAGVGDAENIEGDVE